MDTVKSRDILFRRFLFFLRLECIILLLSLFTARFPLLASDANDPLVERNLFSPERSFRPSETKTHSGASSISADRLNKNLILRGTYCLGRECWAVLELKPPAKTLLHLEELPSRRIVRLRSGENIGDCTVEKVERGRIKLGGGPCGGLWLSLALSPERKRPLPPPGPPVSKPSRTAAAPARTGEGRKPGKGGAFPSGVASSTRGSKTSISVSSRKARSSAPRTGPEAKNHSGKNPGRNPFLELLKRIREGRAPAPSRKAPFPFLPPSGQ